MVELIEVYLNSYTNYFNLFKEIVQLVSIISNLSINNELNKMIWKQIQLYMKNFDILVEITSLYNFPLLVLHQPYSDISRQEKLVRRDDFSPEYIFNSMMK